MLKSVWKLYISLAFMLDKYGNYRSELNLVAFALGSVICYRRLFDSKMHNRSAHQLTALYEILATWFYLCIPIHNIAKNQLAISTVLTILITGIALGVFMIYLSELRDH